MQRYNEEQEEMFERAARLLEAARLQKLEEEREAKRK